MEPTKERTGSLDELRDLRTVIARFIDWCIETDRPVPIEVATNFELIRTAEAYIEAAHSLGEPLVHDPYEILPDVLDAARKTAEVSLSFEAYSDRAS